MKAARGDGTLERQANFPLRYPPIRGRHPSERRQHPYRCRNTKPERDSKKDPAQNPYQHQDPHALPPTNIGTGRVCVRVPIIASLHTCRIASQGMDQAGRRATAASTGRTKRPQSRAAWGSISRELVIEAALRAVNEGRYEQMTIRSLAADLGVGAMSLYRHVRDKDDLLVEVTNRLLASTWKPRARRNDWQAWSAEAAERLRELLVKQPGALHVYLRRPVVSPV